MRDIQVVIGDRPPSCFGVSPGQKFYSFEEQYGRPVVLFLVGAAAAGGLKPVIDAFVERLDWFAVRNTDVLLIVDDGPALVFGPASSGLPIRAVDCGRFLSQCGVSPHDGLVLLLDRNLRVAFSAAPAADSVSSCLACLDRLPQEAPAAVAMPAPVIVLPNLITQEQCRSLIRLFDSSPSIEGEVARIDAAGRPVSVLDHRKKHRRDMMIDPGSDDHRWLQPTLLRRCAGEIAKAFQARVCFTDRLLVSRYDDTGGWFRRHRDNVAENVAFREFALSLNLNTGDYQGGELLFPEYNDHRYAPPAGGGIIFSTSVLHEAAPVTRGCRYVLLTFLHGEAAEAARIAYAAGC